jgi:hypothetical protein
MLPMFGTPARSWSPDDVQAVSRALMACYQDAGNRHNQIDATNLTNANRVLAGLLPRATDTLRKARTDADAIVKELFALPPSADLARGIEALLKANPAVPDMAIVRGLARPAADPIWRLAQVQLTLADADRDTVRKSLAERKLALDASLADDTAKQIIAATNDASGIIRLLELRQRAASLNNPDTRAKLIHDADDKARTIRETLRQAKPPLWTPPDCFELYRWSSVPNSGGITTFGRHSVANGLLDEHAVAVFAVSVGDWTDDDIAHFRALRTFCRAASVPQRGVTAQPDPETMELIQIANRGRWIEGGDQQIIEARAGVADYHKARQDLAALRTKMQALPDKPASIVTLAGFLNDPALSTVSQDDRTAFSNAANEKRVAIGTHLTDAAVKGIDAIKVASVADLKALFQYAAQTLPTLPDQRGQQAFAIAFNHNLDEITKRLLPDFVATLNAVPATIDGLGEVKAAEVGIGDGGRVAGLKPFHDAAHARYDAIVKAVHDRACADLLLSLNLGGDVSQDVWDGDNGIKLGSFICGLAEHGITVNSYSAPGMFSSTLTLKISPIHESMQIISLRKSEVKAGVSMLAGVKIVDASGQSVGIAGAPGGVQGDAKGVGKGDPAVPTSAWEIYARQAKGDSSLVVEACKPIMTSPTDKLGPGQMLFGLHCGTLPDVQRAMAAAPK